MSSRTCGTGPAPTSWWSGSGASSSSTAEGIRPLARVGRDGLLQLRFERRGDRTVLTHRRFTLPLQALEAMHLDGSGAATLMVLNPTGGILGGDALDTEVSLAEGAHVCLATPAATRVYRSEGARARQRFTASLGPGAWLEYVPDHLIPSPGARLRQITDVTLSAGAALLLADAWAVGRVARGERWRFDELDLGLTVRDQRGLVFAERARLDRVARDGLGGTEGFAYHGTFIAVAPDEDGWGDRAAEVGGALSPLATESRLGVSVLGRGGLITRLLCPSAPALEEAMRAAWAACRRSLFGLPPLHLRKL